MCTPQSRSSLARASHSFSPFSPCTEVLPVLIEKPPASWKLFGSPWDLSLFTRSLTHSSTCRFFLSHYILFRPCPPPPNLCSCASLVFFKGSHPFSSLHSLTLSWTIFPSDCWLPPRLSFKSQLKCTSSVDRPPGCLNQISPPRPLTACFVSLASVT